MTLKLAKKLTSFGYCTCVIMAKDTALFFACKRTMSEMKSCISSILKKKIDFFLCVKSRCQYDNDSRH